MSDTYIRLTPTDLRWQPSAAAAAEAVTYVARLFAGPGDAVERVESKFYDKVTLIDAGENTERITCPRCAGDIDLDWWYGVISERGIHFDSLDVDVPCCGARLALNTLQCDWPVGYARFEVSAMNATRAMYQLDARELDDVAKILGHPVTQILAH
jgi:hypothetical protein